MILPCPYCPLAYLHQSAARTDLTHPDGLFRFRQITLLKMAVGELVRVASLPDRPCLDPESAPHLLGAKTPSYRCAPSARLRQNRQPLRIWTARFYLRQSGLRIGTFRQAGFGCSPRLANAAGHRPPL